MASNQKDVNLVIKAQDQSKATLDGVASSIETIAKALNDQVAAAVKGIVKSGELRDTLTKLQQAGSELSRQQGLIQYYETLEDRLDKAKQKVVEVGLAMDQQAQENAKAGDPSSKQIASLERLEKQYTRANAAVDKATAGMAAQGERLATAGIATDNLTAAMARITMTAEATGAAIAVVDDALLNYNKNLRLTREAEEQSAIAAQKAAQARMDAAQEIVEAEKLAAAEYEKAWVTALEENQFRNALVIAERKRAENEYTTWWRGALEQRDAAAKESAAEYEKAWDTALEENQLRGALVVAERKRVENEYTTWWRGALEQRDAAAKESAALQVAAEEQAAAAEAAAIERATAAQMRHEEALKSLNATVGKTNDGSRESLSWYQRVRGEVIALTTAYVGFMGTIGLAKGAIEAFVQQQAAENRLAIVVGNNQAAIGKEWDYVHDQAQRLGIGIKELADSYSSFAIAAKNGNLTLDQTKFAFERITEVMRVNHASSDAIAGSFTQLQQMLSKNKVQMDDLRQASTWIPGLEGMMARGLGMVNVEQLFAQMKKGAVDAKSAVLALAEEMNREYAQRLPDALKSLQAEQGRFNTSVSDFERLIATSGFAYAYTTLLKNLSTFFQSDDGKKFAQEISDAFSQVVKSLGDMQGASSIVIILIRLLGDLLTMVNALTDQGKLLGDILEIAFGIKVYNSLQGMVRGLADVAAKMALVRETALAAGVATGAASAGIGGVGVASGIAAGALTLLSRALGVVGLILLAFDIGKIIYDKVPGVQKAVDTVGVAVTFSIRAWIADAEDLIAKFTGKARQNLADMIPDGMKQGLYMGGINVSPGPVQSGDDIRAERDRRLKSIRDGTDGAQPAGTPIETQAQHDAMAYVNAQQQKLNDILEKRQQLLDAVRQKWKDQQLTQQQAEAETAKIFASFGPQLKQLQGSSAAGAQMFGSNMNADAWQKFMQSMTSATGVYDPNLKPDDEKLQKQRETLGDSLTRQLAAQSAAIQKNDKDVNKSYQEILDERVAATAAAYEKMRQDIERFQKIGGTTIKDANGDDVSVSGLKGRLADMQKQAEVQATQQLQVQGLARAEQDVNDLIKERADRLKDITDKVADGSLSAADGFKQIQQISGPLSERIIAMANAAKQFAESIRGSGAASDSKINAFSANMDRAAAGSGSGATSATGQAGLQAYNAQQKQLNDIIAERNDLVQTYDALVKAGVMTQEQAQQKIQGAYAETKPTILTDIQALKDTLTALHDSGEITDAQFDSLNAKLQLLGTNVDALDPKIVKLKETIENDFADGVGKAFEGIADSIGGLINGTKSWGDVWKDLGTITRSFFADFFKQIAEALIKQEALSFAQSAMGFLGLGAGAAAGAGGGAAAASASDGIAMVAHSGALVGAFGGTRRAAPSAWFANAPRYHKGTVVGLKHDEQTAILQKGEEVLSKQDPRNIMNSGRSAPSQGGATGVRIINSIDPGMFKDYMDSSAGEQVHLNVIRRNASSVKQIIQDA